MKGIRFFADDAIKAEFGAEPHGMTGVALFYLGSVSPFADAKLLQVVATE